MVITDLAVFRFGPEGLTLAELMPGATLDEVRERTDATFVVAERVAGRTGDGPCS